MIYYSLDKLKEKNSNFNILFGKRNNGKSYQLKKLVLKEYFESGNRFIYLRRTVNEIKKELVENYFDDFDIYELSNHKYNCIVVKSNKFYFANNNPETNKIVLGEKFGYIWSLIHYNNYKSGVYLDVNNIIFEEFMTDSLYLYDEPKKLDSIYSTVDRNRLTTKLWLVGNAISRVNPYLNGWNIRDIFLKLKIGEIKTTNIITNDGIRDNNRTISIEYCSSDAGGKGLSLASNMNDSGEFEISKQPLLPKSYKKYKSNYKFVFVYQNFMFLCEYLSDAKDTLFFIRPKYTPIKKNTLVIGDIIKPGIYYQRNIYDLHTRNKNLNDLLYSFNESNLFFSDHRTGTEFKQLIDFTIRR